MSFTSWVRGKSKAYIFGLASFAALAGVAGGMFVQGPSVIAGVCDRTNIIRCGLNGSSHASYIQSFQHFYTTNHDPGGGYNDLQGIFNWAGFNSSLVAGMNTTNTKIGYVYRNGEVKVNGERVGAGAQVTTRYAGKGRPQIMPGVYVRSAAENKHNPESILVLFDQKGQAIAGVMTRCGNAIKITPVKRSLTCDSLKAVPTHKPREYQLTATATPTNMNIESYVFSYGDGQQSTVNTAARSAKTLHTYPADNTKYTAKVTVKAKNSFGVTSATCQTTLTTPRPAVSIDKKVSGSELVPVGQNYNYQYKAGNLVNTACVNAKEVNPGNPTKQDDCDDAVVKVPAPVYSCDSLTLQKGANRTVTATVAYTAENGATYKNTTLVWGDSKQTVIDGKTSTHTYAAYGTYTVNAEMLFNVNGSVKAPAPNAACVKQVTFEAPKTPSVKIDKKVEGKESLKVEIDKP
ncbi:hypothetical protein CSA80_04890 [Candidatus Saccharibacteria bacterium]|nr:MAG: hypothetical protein CSA80_04890 [Candidatus Saccharibacteria bacterium]